MKTELEVELLKLIQSGKEHIPEILQQVLQWGLIDNLIGVFIGTLLIVVAYKVHMKYKGRLMELDTPLQLFAVCIGYILGPIVLTTAAAKILKILLFPSLYLLDKVL